MLSKHSLRIVGVLLGVAVSSSGWAGWHGAMLRPVPVQARQPLPPLAGIIHERAGRGPVVTPFGHYNGGYAAPARRDAQRGYGGAYGPRGREAFEGDRRRYGYYPRADQARGRYPYGYGYGYGGYAGGAGYPSPITAPDTGGYIYAGSGGGYAEPSLGGYAEPPLDPSYGYGQVPLPSSAPQVIVVNRPDSQPAAPCSCGPVAPAGSPVVYRYGVGTPY